MRNVIDGVSQLLVISKLGLKHIYLAKNASGNPRMQFEANMKYITVPILIN